MQQAGSIIRTQVQVISKSYEPVTHTSLSQKNLGNDLTVANLLKQLEKPNRRCSRAKRISLVNDKAQDLMIKKLTRNNPTMTKKFKKTEK